MNEVDKAERMQAWKAFLIPSSLFVACLFNAAGIYILYSGSSVGVVFVGIGFAIIITGMFLFVTFQNQHRARGQWKRIEEPQEDFTPPAAIDHNDATPVDPIPAYVPPGATVNR